MITILKLTKYDVLTVGLKDKLSLISFICGNSLTCQNLPVELFTWKKPLGGILLNAAASLLVKLVARRLLMTSHYPRKCNTYWLID